MNDSAAGDRGISQEEALAALIDLHADTVNDVRYKNTPEMQREAAALHIAIRLVRDHFASL